MDDAPPPLRPNAVTFDNFTIIRKLGSGAMGEVFLATESLTNRTVALKVMNAKYGSDAAFIKRFEREILILAALEHPSIALYAGHGVANGRPYLAVEYIDGPTLAAFIGPSQPLPERLAIYLTMLVADALSYADRKAGLIHRDIKPENVLVDLKGLGGLTEQSTIKLIDFGIAQTKLTHDYGEFGPADDSVFATSMTMAGDAIGTPYYMSPEQINGEKDITFAADMYSLGATLFHMLTGRPPFTGPNAGMVQVAHLNAPVPDPGAIIRTLRPATSSLVMRCLAKTAVQRYKNWDQLISALKSAQFIASQPDRRPTTSFVRRDPSGTHRIGRSHHDGSDLISEALAGLAPPPKAKAPTPSAAEESPAPVEATAPASEKTTDEAGNPLTRWFSAKFKKSDRKP